MDTMDLFTPRFKDERLHPYFKSLITNEEFKPIQETLTMWSTGLLDRKKESNKFINEFQYDNSLVSRQTCTKLNDKG